MHVSKKRRELKNGHVSKIRKIVGGDSTKLNWLPQTHQTATLTWTCSSKDLKSKYCEKVAHVGKKIKN
ncbi:hypothetical protein B9Z55_022181 [Caenorhabditis nigoni]|uniref:Uncharacterized protein n=1 Tax=Caenorhabditis nigoni TaxID=1611254 RepID=A0A2G5SJL4_9PELO|nr:hypothetical protein B9Z55_022181 [Caenorhabditis nigoni]